MFDAGPGDAFVLRAERAGGRIWTAVIDGGPPRTPDRGLKQHLWDVAVPPADAKASAYVDLLVVSHIDQDHIGGAIDLMIDTPGVSPSSVAGFSFGTVWHNSFANLATDRSLVASADLRRRVTDRLAHREYRARDREQALAIVASVPQGIRLSDLIAANDLTGNPPFDGLITQGAIAHWRTEPRITVVGPPSKAVDALRRYWMREVNNNLALAHKVTYAAAGLDQSVPNLSSLVFLFEHDGRRILFTGDARGDQIVAQLAELDLLVDGAFEVDALKVPHHGSERSCTADLFATVRAEHYLISGDGSNGNPSVAMADRLCRARRGEAFTVWLTHDVTAVTTRFRREPRVEVMVRAPDTAGVIIDV